MPDFAYLGGEQGKGKLESALTAPRQTWDGQYLAALCYNGGVMASGDSYDGRGERPAALAP